MCFKWTKRTHNIFTQGPLSRTRRIFAQGSPQASVQLSFKVNDNLRATKHELEASEVLRRPHKNDQQARNPKVTTTSHNDQFETFKTKFKIFMRKKYCNFCCCLSHAAHPPRCSTAMGNTCYTNTLGKASNSAMSVSSLNFVSAYADGCPFCSFAVLVPHGLVFSKIACLKKGILLCEKKRIKNATDLIYDLWPVSCVDIRV